MPRITLPVWTYADEERNLLALQADVAVSPQVVSGFASCLTYFLTEYDAPNQGKLKALGETEGFVKIVSDADTDDILVAI